MARAKYDPLKSNRSSFGKRPKLTWSDKRSGDSVGKGLKRGSYQAWTAYHSLPKKYFKPAKSTRSSSSFKIKRCGRTSISRLSSDSSKINYSPSDIARLRKLTKILEESSTTEPIPEEDAESSTSAAKGSEVLSSEVLQELRGEAPLSNDVISEASFKSDVRANGPLFGGTQPKNTDRCPHCGFVFPKAPKRGRACENCGQKFIVRSNCLLYNSIFLTPEESAANDCFTRLSYSIDHPEKLAKRLLAENPDLSPGELFMKMIEADESKRHSIYDNTAEQKSWLYHMVAEYEEACGRKASELHKRALAASRAKSKERKEVDKMFDDISKGEIDIWK